MDKIEITKELLKTNNLNLSLKDALTLWWYPDYSTKSNNSRLTSAGCAVISDAMHSFRFDCDLSNTGNDFKKLSKLNTPYYYEIGSITIFSSPLAVMIRMYDSFDRYLELINT